MRQNGIYIIVLGIIAALAGPAGLSAAGQTIRLRNATLDTAAQPQAKLAAAYQAMFSGSTAANRRLPFIVQFVGPVQPAWKQAVEQTGARLGGYLPENAFIVEATLDQLDRVAALEVVQWLGPYQPEYKIEPALSRRFAAADQVPADFTIETFAEDTLPVVRDAVIAAGGRILSAGSVGRHGLLRVRIAAAAATELVRLPEVEFIEAYVAPQLHNNIATDGEHMNLQSLWTHHNLTGAGQIVCVADTGLDTGDTNTLHPDFSNRIVAAFGLGRPGDWSDSTTNSNGGHGTHVSGSVLGSGAAWSNGLYRGAAYAASLVVQSIMDSNGQLGGIPDTLTNLFNQAYASKARIHTDSWGSAVYGAYDSSSQSADQFMWDIRDMLILFSAGNSGRDANNNGVIDTIAIGSPGTAKNVLTVGASESKRPSGSGGYSAYVYGTGSWLAYYPVDPIRHDLISTAFDTCQGMAAFSSRGPCVDGRFKPDIVAPGTDIISCRSRMPGADTLWGTGSGVLGNASSNYYTFSGGTSMSTPLTAGAAALVRQYLQEQRGYDAPSAALMKAIMVNGARSLTPGQYGVGQYLEIPAIRPNNIEGWGQVDLANTLFSTEGLTNIYYDTTRSTDSMATGGEKTYLFTSSAAGPVNITLCWSDYPASLAAAVQLVNDLDLTVITRDGSIQYPNGLTSADRLNNIEGITLTSVPAGTTLQIKVRGYNVPNGPQPYALVIRGIGTASAAVTPLSADFDGDGKADPAIYDQDAGRWILFLSGSQYSRTDLGAGYLGGAGSLPVVADYDGDRKADPAVCQAATGRWSIKLSGSGYGLAQVTDFGAVGYTPLVADFDGDGKADPVVYQTATGNWHIKLSGNNYLVTEVPGFGGPGYTPLAADFDADGKADPAVYQTSSGNWYVKLSDSGYGIGILSGFGAVNYLPLAADFDADGKADPAIQDPVTGTWWIKLSASNYQLATVDAFGGVDYANAYAADYDGDRKADPGLYQLITGTWYIKLSASGYGVATLNSGYSP